MRIKRLSVALCVLLAALVLGACAPSAAQTKKANEDKLVKAIHKEIEMMDAGNLDGVMALYADGAVQLPPGAPAAEGKEAIAAGYRDLFSTYKVSTDFKLVDYTIVGDHATRRGQWTQTLTPKAGGAAETVNGKCMLGWKLVNGEWKIDWEVFNTDGGN